MSASVIMERVASTLYTTQVLLHPGAACVICRLSWRTNICRYLIQYTDALVKGCGIYLKKNQLISLFIFLIFDLRYLD